MITEKIYPVPVAPDFDVLCGKLKIDEDYTDEFREIFDECNRIAKPKMICTKCSVKREDDGKTVFVGDIRFQSKVLHKNMEGISFVWPYVATCGRELYAFAEAQDDPLSEYWINCISEEYLRQALQEGLHQVQLKEGTGALSAMNPGSLPDWPISQQRPLFALLGDVMGEIGVALTESFLMLPVKSVSGLLFEAKEHYTNCSLCPKKGCPNRREPFNETLYMEKYHLGEM